MSERSAVQRAFSRAAGRYRSAAGLQRVVSDHLLDLLPPEVEAGRVLDLGCGIGFASGELATRHPDAQVIAADFSPGMLGAHEAASCCLRVCADAHRLPFADAGIDLIFSSLMLQWCDLPRALSECARALRPGGVICFSTVLNGSLREIDAAFAGVDHHRHTVVFPQVARVHEALVQAGLGVERIERATRVEHFADARSLLQSIRDIGASRVPVDGRRALLGRAALRRVHDSLESLRTAQGIPLSYELVWVVARRTVRHGGCEQ